MFFSALLAFCGQYIGLLLALLSPEELKPGFRYFVLLSDVVLLLLLLSFLPAPFSAWLFLLGIILGWFFSFPYFFLSLGLFSGQELFSSLVFLYGFPYGTILTIRKKRFHFILNAVFFILAFILSFLLFSLSSLAFGGVLAVLAKDIKSALFDFSHAVPYRTWVRR
ncbi:hypothetical protein HZB00_01645 [Candidatus Woesearchaeota archaeon]|nr:hypothetical protein [Candidatus Woesearchaeota archaeon]